MSRILLSTTSPVCLHMNQGYQTTHFVQESLKQAILHSYGPIRL